ncbi:GNAT family N-acetyltransferase [Aeribacillus alveayuensis]|uniref:GNAT superfamily N-acetyltransferase n=1 Tax=Aeribacillus alveayuensis TaxID=279215 RepID=A0ABT9VST4_9BACI|nr:GNAT superfamily N-acetyltransferase [Bacillus alveayuensis]
MNIVRKMKDEDIESVERIAKITWRDTNKGIMDEEFLEEFLKIGYSKQAIKSRAQDTIFFVAEYNQRVVGFVNIMPNYFGYNKSVLAAIYVEPIYQRKGIGTMLINTIIEQLPKNCKLFADLERKNKGGKKFFEKMGFTLFKKIDAKIGNYKFDRIRVVFEN